MNPLGTRGEQVAAKYLKDKGYIIADKNFRTPLGEIDIICKYKDTLIFVEVKTRTSNYKTEPYTAVNYKKRLHAKRAILLYVKEKKVQSMKLRYDIISIIVSGDSHSIEHIENVDLE